ncbi:COPT2 protein, partial [Menura novaehollandiae]|nr:COPT2 protein [Menura novaehollandiae]
SPAGMVLSVLVILLLSVLYEAVKMGKAVLLRRALLALPRSLSQETLTEPEEGDPGPAQGRYHRDPPLHPPPLVDGISHLFPRWFWYHVGQTLFHVVQVVLAYMVMLAVMSYNAWIFLGAIVGSTLGYFV